MEWLRKRTKHFPTRCKRYRLNPQNQLCRHCMYGLYKTMISAPTKENALTLAAVDTGGKSTQEQGQIRVWALPTAGPEVTSSQYCRASYSRVGGVWLTVGERTPTVQTQKYSYYCIPWTGETGGLQSIGSQRVGHDWMCIGARTRTHIPLIFWFTL